MIDKKQRFTQALLLPIATVFILVVIIAGLLWYRHFLQEDLNAANCEILNQMMEQQQSAFSSKLLDQQNSLKTYAGTLSNAEEITAGQLLDKLVVITKNSTFDFVSYVKPNGDTIENTGVRLNVADRDYLRNALHGETVIANPMTSKVTGGQIITFATPVMNQGRIIGALVGIYDVENLSELLTASFDGKGYTYIVGGDGGVILKTEHVSALELGSNLLDGLEQVDMKLLDDAATIRANLSVGKSGHSRYDYEGETRMLHYAPLGVKDWYIFSIAPDTAIVPQTISIVERTTWFLLAVSCVSVLVSVAFFLAQRSYMKNLKELAFVDSLTGEANHKSFKLAAAELLAAGRDPYAFVILDVDKFKVLNDTFGYTVGDEFLISMAKLLKQQIGKAECFGRRDSDEFYLLLLYTDEPTLKERLQGMLSQIEAKFHETISDTYNLVLCAGVYVVQNPHVPIGSISDKARHAQRLIKGADQSDVCFYQEDIRNKILEEKEIENKMHSALKNEDFLLYLQPKYELDHETICGAEALARWNDRGKLIGPDAFIPVFEKTGFISKLDMYMLEKSCQILRAWIDGGLSPVPISINFSRVDLKKPGFVDDLAEIVERYQIPTRLIELELTESTMLHNERVVMEMLGHLHAHGFALSMDDFGSGYSSLGLLKNLPIDIIKLDKTFFMDYGELKRGVTVISGIISIAKSLGIQTVAEGVETKDQVVFLKEMGCDMVQGYYYAKPMPAAAMTGQLDVLQPLNGRG